MTMEMLVLDSGEWRLGAELAAAPWYVLIYRQHGEPHNELHLWLPRQGTRRAERYACRRYWLIGAVRWCVETPADPFRDPATPPSSARLRFTSPDGETLWAENPDGAGLADLPDRALRDLLRYAARGSYTGA